MSKKFPRYKCHKVVGALEISDVTDFRVHFADKSYNSIPLEAKMISRYKPVPGDYLVEYEDNYKAFSPRSAFLNGYTKEENT